MTIINLFKNLPTASDVLTTAMRKNIISKQEKFI